MAGYARSVRAAYRQELSTLQACKADMHAIQAARRWLHRDTEKVPARAMPHVAQVRAASPVIDKMLEMREELRQLWLNTNQNRSQLTVALQTWCRKAEASGIAALQEFSVRLRAAHI